MTRSVNEFISYSKLIQTNFLTRIHLFIEKLNSIIAMVSDGNKFGCNEQNELKWKI